MSIEFASIIERPNKIIEASPTAADNVTLLEKTVDDVKAGERIKVHGWMVVDAMGQLVGLTAHIGYTDFRGTRTSVIWPNPFVHFWDAGNVWRRNGEHHKVFNPTGHYISQRDQDRVTFTLLLNVYCSVPEGREVNVQSCGMTFERYS